MALATAGAAYARGAAAAPAPEPLSLLKFFKEYVPYVAAGIGILALGGVMAGLVNLALSSRSKNDEPLLTEGCVTVRDALQKVYFGKVRPIEEELDFGSFYSPSLTAGDFNAKPSVLLLGQYSTGKTTFIKHLLKRDYPGMLIGPEPTTDKFVVIGHGEKDSRIPGNTLVITSSKPYQALATYGDGFLSRLEEVQMNHDLLESVTFIDTPGILSGEKQRLGRAYSFIDVCSWFASRSDMILLLFDPFKLDISDEFRQVIESMRDHHDKIRVVLNKADQVGSQELLRVYGALMWSLAKVLTSPEVSKVYTGSFADESILQSKGYKSASAPLEEEFFEREQAHLLKDLEAIPQHNRDRKIGEFTKRVRAAKTHLILIYNLQRRLSPIAARWSEERLMDNLEIEFEQLKNSVNLRTYQLAPGDFPSVSHFRESCRAGNSLRGLPRLSHRQFKQRLAALDEVLHRELPHISTIKEM